MHPALWISKTGLDAKQRDISVISNNLANASTVLGFSSQYIDKSAQFGISVDYTQSEQVKLLAKRSDLKGLAVPGMPMGSPGMEMGDHKDAYQVIGLDRQGQEQVVSSYPGN